MNNVYLDELMDLDKLVTCEQLLDELEHNMDDTVMTLKEASQNLVHTHACDLLLNNKHLKKLKVYQHMGQTWNKCARHVLSQPYKTIEELDEFRDIDVMVLINLTIPDHISIAWLKAKEFKKQAQTWLIPEPRAMKP